MAGNLVRFDLSLPKYFSYPPAPGVDTRPMIPRKEERQLYMRGEFGIKPDGRMRPISAHSTTHMDCPYHFFASGKDLAGLLNRPETVGDRPCLARVVTPPAQPGAEGVSVRDGLAYKEAVSAQDLPEVEELRSYEALVVLTGFGGIMENNPGAVFSPAEDGGYHVPYLEPGAVEKILASGLGLVAIDSTTVEKQTSIDPLRFGSEVHFQLLGAEPPVLIVEGLGGGGLAEKVGFQPSEGLLQMVTRRVNAEGAEAAHGRAFLYFYRDDGDGAALRALARAMTPGEFYG